MTKFVLSTATCSQKFVKYNEGKNGSVHTPIHSVLIRGGANSPSLTSGFGDLANTEQGQPLWTPQGVVTSVSDEDAAFLAGHEGFKKASELGFYKILDKDPGDSHAKVKKVVQSDMTPRDASAPLNATTLKSQVKVSTKLIEE